MKWLSYYPVIYSCCGFAARRAKRLGMILRIGETFLDGPTRVLRKLPRQQPKAHFHRDLAVFVFSAKLRKAFYANTHFYKTPSKHQLV
jgi:hypothetical protein